MTGWYGLYAVLTILIFYCMDTPNIFGRAEAGDHFHAHAYYNSGGHQVSGFKPYTDTMTSIYGHYGLLFKIPMKLVGGDFRMFVLMIAALGTLAHVCAFLVLELTVESRILRALGSCCGISGTRDAGRLLLAGMAASDDLSDDSSVVCGDFNEKTVVE